MVSLVAALASTLVMYFGARAHGLDLALLTGDAKGYAILAKNILEHGVFSVAQQPPYYPESFRSPGYPFFLAGLFAIFHSWTAVMFAQVLLLSVLPVLLYLLLRPYHERAAFWGAIVFAVEPVHLYLSSTLLSDALFALLFLGSLLLLERGREGKWLLLGLGGAVLGAAILMRPIAMFLPLLYVAYVLVPRPTKSQLIAAVALVAGVLLVVLPWSLRNWAHFHSLNVSSVGAYNLMLYNAPEYLKYNPDVRGQAVYEQFLTEQSALPRQEALSLTRSEVFTATFRDIIRGHEVDYAFFHLFKTLPFFASDGLRDTVRLFKVDIGTMPNITTALLRGQVGTVVTYIVGGGVAPWLLVLGSGFWALVTLAWLWSCYVLLRQRNWRALFFVCVLVLYFAALTGPVSNARYRLPAEGFLLVGAAAAVLSLRKHA
jgi:4-amino-4-deoxy-L-arabinose transferase-like glycosyltransferase